MANILRSLFIIFAIFNFSFSETFENIFNKNKNNNLFNQNGGSSDMTQNGFFQRFYIYGSTSNYTGLQTYNKDVRENSAGINLTKTLDLPFGSKSILRVDARAIFNNYKESKSKEDMNFNELYVKAKINDVDISIGREYIDFSIAKTYTMLHFISKPLTPIDLEDTEVSKKGDDGVNVAYTPSWMEGSKIFFYTTTNYATKSNAQEEDNKLIARFKIYNPYLVSNLYASYGSKKKDILGLSIIANINKDSAIYSEARYTNSIFDYLIGIKYEAYKNLQILLERVILKSGNHRIDLERWYDNNQTILAEHYNRGLSGNHYINGFVKYSFPNSTSSLYISATNNMIDESFRASAKVDYWYGRIRFYIAWIRNIGKKGSEFSYKEDAEVKLHVSINLTDNKDVSNFMK